MEGAQPVSDDIWLASFRTSYRYARVSRPTGLETGAIECFTGGSISRNQDTDTYESASLDYVGRLDMGNDFRAYLPRRGGPDLGRVAHRVPGDLRVLDAVPHGERRGGDRHRDALRQTPRPREGRLRRAVHRARRAQTRSPRQGDRGGVRARGGRGAERLHAVDGMGLRIAATADTPDNKLGAVNRLLSVAGFRSASTDAYGRVLFRRYLEPAARPIDRTFSEGEDCRVLPDLTDEQDDFDAVNVVHVDFATQGESVRGTASDDSPQSEWSTVSTGRRIVKRYQYSDLPSGESVIAGGSYPLAGDGTHDSATFRSSGGRGDHRDRRRLRVPDRRHQPGDPHHEGVGLR